MWQCRSGTRSLQPSRHPGKVLVAVPGQLRESGVTEKGEDG